MRITTSRSSAGKAPKTGAATGPQAIEAMLVENLGTPEPGFVNTSNFHMITNPLIAIDGERATVTSRYLFWSADPSNRPTPSIAGRYVDEFVREGGAWKIARRTTWGQIPFRDPAAPATGAPPYSGPSVEERLRRAEDILAIQRVIVDYAARIDAQDFDAYVDLFAEDGIWQNGTVVHQGRAAIKAMLVGIFGNPSEGYVNSESYHLVSNPQVEVNGDRATARSRHLLIMRGEGGSPTPELTGLYEDEFVRVDGEWKIARRVDNPVMPTREEWLKEMQARQAGR